MIFIFYLASGNSKRFLGKNKLLIEFQGKPLFCHGLDTLCNAIQDRTDCKLVVVSRYDEILQYAKAHDVSTVYSEDSVHGLSYSIRAGLNGVGDIAETDFISFVVADQPFLREATIKELLSSITSQTEILSLCHEGRLGNPKIFSGKLAVEFQKLVGDEGGKAILANHKVEIIPVTSPLELFDIDQEDCLIVQK